MDALMRIQNWLEEFKTKYKPIFICPAPKDYNDPEEYLSELREINEISGQTCVTLSITVKSLEEFGVLVRYLREKSGVKMLYDDDEKFGHPIDRFNPKGRMKTYETPKDFYFNRDTGSLNGTELYLEIEPKIFTKFWKEFWEEFIVPCKYVLDSSQFYRKYKYDL